MPIRHRTLSTGMVLNLSGQNRSLDEADHALLHRCRILRVDPSDSCNANCIFCETSFSSRGARLPLAVFEEALAGIASSPDLDTIQFGCTYEPTIRKDFSAFGRAFERSGVGWQAKVVAIVSNCWLLHRHDLRPFVDGGLNKLHVSVHAHDHDTFAAVMGRDDLRQLTRNMAKFKADFPTVPVSAVCVVTTLNADAPVDFARWAFFEAGVDYLRFTRAHIVGKIVDSPAKAALDQLSPGSTYALDDEQWRVFVDKVQGVTALGLDLLESVQNLKNSSISVDTLRVKRAGAPKEIAAIRQARLVALGV